MTPPAHWRRTRRLTAVLLVAWFLASFVAPFFARELDATVWGWPFSFWMGAQGSLFVYLLIVGVYAWRMRRHDDALDAASDAGD
jgi:putative solute:sodium symporter small subunit